MLKCCCCWILLCLHVHCFMGELLVCAIFLAWFSIPLTLKLQGNFIIPHRDRVDIILNNMCTILYNKLTRLGKYGMVHFSASLSLSLFPVSLPKWFLPQCVPVETRPISFTCITQVPWKPRIYPSLSYNYRLINYSGVVIVGCRKNNSVLGCRVPRPGPWLNRYLATRYTTQHQQQQQPTSQPTDRPSLVSIRERAQTCVNLTQHMFSIPSSRTNYIYLWIYFNCQYKYLLSVVVSLNTGCRLIILS